MSGIIILLVLVALLISITSYRRKLAAAGGAGGRPVRPAVLVATIVALAVIGAVLAFYLVRAGWR